MTAVQHRPNSRAAAAASITALFVTTAGDEIALVALMLFLANAGHSGLAVSALLMAGLVPGVLLSPFAGAIVDRRDARGVAAIALVAQGAIVTAMSFVESPLAIIALAFVLGTFTALVAPAVFALVPTIVGQSGWARANAFVSSSANLGSLVGPVAGGIVVATAGTRLALIVDALSFVVAAAILRLVAPRRPPAESRPGEDTRRFALDGLRALLIDRVIRTTLPVVVAGVIASSMTNVALVFFVRGPLNGSSIAYGTLVAAWGFGLVAGPLFALRVFGVRFLPYVPIGATCIIGGALTAAAVSGSIVAAVVPFVVGGAANGIQNVAMRTLLHARTPSVMHGRVYAAYFGLASAAVVLGFIVAGAVATGSSRSTLLVAGTVTLALGLVGVARIVRAVRNERRHHARHPAGAELTS